MARRGGVFLTLWLAAHQAIISEAATSLLLAYSIHRHGARNQLPKSIFLQESTALDGTTLLPQGQRLCYNAGRAYRARYIDPETCAPTGTCLKADQRANGDLSYGLVTQAGFSNFNTYIRSSFVDRTLLSAQAVIAGMFPAVPVNSTARYTPTGQAMVPVYTHFDTDDWLIRAYTKCNTYSASTGSVLTRWYQSPEFQAKAAESAPLRDYLKTDIVLLFDPFVYTQLVPNMNLDLTNFWNVYDSWNVYQTYGQGETMPPVNATIFNKMVQLATWLEISKMNTTLTQNMLGGPLLGDMIDYMDAAVLAASSNTGEYYKLLQISAHYNVQLGVLAALQMFLYAPAVDTLNWLTNKIPALASQAVFELLAPEAGIAQADNGNIVTDPTSVPGVAVRLVVQDGPSATWLQVPLPCAVAGDAAEQLAGPGACTYSNYRSLAMAQALPTAEAWCTKCNVKTGVRDCEVVAARAALQQGSDDSDEVSRLRKGLIAGIILSFFGGIAISAAVFTVMYSRAKQYWAPKAKDLHSFSSIPHPPAQVI